MRARIEGIGACDTHNMAQDNEKRVYKSAINVHPAAQCMLVQMKVLGTRQPLPVVLAGQQMRGVCENENGVPISNQAFFTFY